MRSKKSRILVDAVNVFWLFVLVALTTVLLRYENPPPVDWSAYGQSRKLAKAQIPERAALADNNPKPLVGGTLVRGRTQEARTAPEGGTLSPIRGEMGLFSAVAVFGMPVDEKDPEFRKKID